GWRQPRCVQACPTGALSVLHIADEELAEVVRIEGLETIDSEGPETKQRCYYKNLHRFTSAAIFGSIATTINGVTECVAGATVRLQDPNRIIAEQETDDFGDFKFDRLPPGRSEVYELEVVCQKRVAAKVQILKDAPLALGTIWI
ncbi:MAG TPA: oxidoreductase, partial [Desulfobulbaceae bacterium]|nr:oxidoreductase [Desulfobulbaceae bacterium]